MEEDYDRKKIIETLIDPNISIILSELEDEDKESSYLTEKLQLTDTQIRERLAYVIQHGFVKITQNGNKIVFAADKEKLDKIMQSDENFSGVVDGLTKMDSFLN